MEIKIMKLYENATIPSRESKCAAGYDLYAFTNSLFRIAPHTTEKINTGVAIEIPDGYCGLVFPRSGLSSRHGLRLANCVGVIDSDYRGEIMVALHNDSENFQYIDHNQRIAQIVIVPYLQFNWKEVEFLNETERGSSGFGSTGK